jgi:hypothetical protein
VAGSQGRLKGSESLAKLRPIRLANIAHRRNRGRGTVTVALLLDSETVVPPVGAVPLIVTVQLAVPGPVTVPGVQLRLATCSCCCAGDTLSPVVAVLPFKPAVSVALTVVPVVPAEAVNVAKVCPAATNTLDGTVTEQLFGIDNFTLLQAWIEAPRPHCALRLSHQKEA